MARVLMFPGLDMHHVNSMFRAFNMVAIVRGKFVEFVKVSEE